MKLSLSFVETVDLLLVPKPCRFNFDRARWARLRERQGRSAEFWDTTHSIDGGVSHLKASTPIVADMKRRPVARRGESGDRVPGFGVGWSVMRGTNDGYHLGDSQSVVARSAHLAAADSRRGLRVVAVLTPGRVGEMEDRIPVVGDDGIVEDERPDRSPVLKRASLPQTGSGGLPMIGHFDRECERCVWVQDLHGRISAP